MLQRANCREVWEDAHKHVFMCGTGDAQVSEMGSYR